MNHPKSRYLRNCMFFALCAISLCLFTPHLFANSDTNLIAGATSISAAAGNTLGGSSILAWFISFASGNPKWAAIIALLVAIRVPMKMLMTALDSYAKKNLPPGDYAVIVHYEHSKTFSIISWLLDTLVSVKLPVIKGYAATGVNTPPAATVTMFWTALLIGGATLCGCAQFDKPLPGQTAPAPLFVITNGAPYVLGNLITTNRFETIVSDAVAIDKLIVLKEWPDATNYITDIQLAVTTLDGAYSPTALTNALKQITLKNPQDKQLLDGAITFITGEAETYLNPLITSGGNSPYVSSGLDGFVEGLNR